jgi:long-chain acyl-CoA synthetase
MAKAEYYVPDDRPWFKFYPEGVPHHLDYPEIPLYQFLDDSAEKYPHKTALVFYGKEITYQELKELSDKFANALQGLGIQKGDRVFFLLPNCPQFVIAFYGTMKAGAIPVPFNPLYSAEELKYFFHDAEPRIVLALDAFYDKVEEAAKVTPQIEKIIVTSIADYFPSFQRTMGKLLGKIPSPQCPNALHFLDFIKESEPKYNPVKIDPKDDVAIMLYTSGTTGEPKGGMLTNFNVNAHVMSTSQLFKDIELDSVFFGMPNFHIYGIASIISWSIFRGMKIIIVPNIHIKELSDLINKKNINFLPLVPAIYSGLCNYAEKQNIIFKSVKLALCGSSPLSPYLLERLKKIFPNAFFMEGYGLTEASSAIIADVPFKGYTKKVNSVGIPFFDTDAKIIDFETKQELLINQLGELILKGPQIFKGYWKKPEKTKEVLKDGWFYTKDIGRMDEDGIFYIEGRLDDMINVRGEKVWPEEVEKVLESHPKVREAAVIGVADDYYGQAIKACVVLKEGQEATKEELIEFCKDKLAPYKVPHIIEFFNELPKSNLGKTLHYKLKEQGNK